MQLRNEFVVPVPIEEAWTLLTDLQGVAECMPGVVLDTVDEGVHSGRLDVKVGPVKSQYRGRASFTERDGSRYVAVLRAQGSGRVAQFGRGVVADVSRTLLDQFADRLNARIVAGADTAPPVAPSSVNFVAVAGVPIAKRLIPVVLGLAVVVIVAWRTSAT